MTHHDFGGRAILLCWTFLALTAASAAAQSNETPVQADTAHRADSLVGPVEDTLAASAEGTGSQEWMLFAFANGIEENYLRYLQIAGNVKEYPWGIRSFSRPELAALAAVSGSHPWSGSSRFSSRRRSATMIPLTAEVRHNTGFPYGSNDGAVWAGRGATAVATAGVAVAAGPFSLLLSPVAFATQNTAFPLLDNGLSGSGAFRDGLYPNAVDRPQRFGDEPYGRVDPGQSTLRVVLGPLQLGAGTENIAWGPMQEYPFIVGSNAPGFAHAFAGTSRPLNVFLAHVHTQLLWGELEQSDYSSVTGSRAFSSLDEPGTRRFASGMVLLFVPRGAPGLELGFTRFIHSSWPAGGLPGSYLRKPWERLFSSRIQPSPDLEEGRDFDNQLFSLFARWAFPAARLEVYGEYGREDHSQDLRDFILEFDHSRSYGLGLRHVFRVDGSRLDGLTIELINFQLPNLDRSARGEGEIYLHGLLRQGHTHRGQLLGADVGVSAAAGFTMRWDRYTRGGRTAVSARRIVRQERGSFHETGVVDTRPSDILYVLDLEGARGFGWVELTAGTALMRNLNRNFSDGAWNASTFIRAQLPLFTRR